MAQTVVPYTVLEECMERLDRAKQTQDILRIIPALLDFLRAARIPLQRLPTFAEYHTFVSLFNAYLISMGRQHETELADLSKHFGKTVIKLLARPHDIGIYKKYIQGR